MRLIVVLLSLFSAALAQAGDFRPELSDVAQLPVHVAPPADLRKALAAARTKGDPLQFAVSVPLRVTPAGGRWQELADGRWSWRARVQSPGAWSLNFEFGRAALPAGAELWVYAADGRSVQGPYGELLDAQGRLWTAQVAGEDAVIEVRVPAAAMPALQLELGVVHHAYKSFYETAKAAGDSGACNIDVACAEGNAWRDEIRAETLLQVGGNALCSGTLVNNVTQNNRPLLLTARHCGIRANNVTSVFAYFNFQSSGCGVGQDPTASDNPNIQAANHLVTTAESSDVQADMTLIELASTPSEPAFCAYYAGWNASGSDVPSGGSSIHHPSGDNKKISLYNTPPTRVENASIGSPPNTFVVDAWRVNWSAGTTEQGSSGSPLYDQSKRIVGVLSGGGASCNTPDSPDFYGRLDVGFPQLRPFLDPANSGVTSLGGKNVGSCTSGTTTGSTTGTPTGSTTGGGYLGGGDSGGGGGLPATLIAGLALLLALGARRRR